MRSGSREQRRSRFVLQRDELRCYVCGNLNATEVDHVIPLCEGGSDDLDNLKAICAPDHKVKSEAERKRAIERSRSAA